MGLDELPLRLASYLHINGHELCTDYGNRIGTVTNYYCALPCADNAAEAEEIFSFYSNTIMTYRDFLLDGVREFNENLGKPVLRAADKYPHNPFQAGERVISPEEVLRLLYNDTAQEIDERMDEIKKAFAWGHEYLDHALIFGLTLEAYELMYGENRTEEARRQLTSYFKELGLEDVLDEPTDRI